MTTDLIDKVPVSITDAELWAEIERRQQTRKLRVQYNKILPDPEKAPGPGNLGIYPWQAEWHNAGAQFTERLLMAANRVGKTRSASAEVAIHATGLYPEWWEGRRFPAATKGWVCAETTEDCKNIIQEALLGQSGAYGTGWIPEEKIVGVTYRQSGIPEVVETITVRHVTGQLSRITQKTYQMEARGFRGESLDYAWADELIPMSIYTECLTRLIDRRGIMLVTFTPTEGPGEVVRHFMNPMPGASIWMKNVGWNDVTHLDEKTKREITLSYPAHERDTRTKGTPMLGTGAIFPIRDEDLMIPPFDLPPHWARINGIDFGIGHPGAGAFCAHDRDTDTFYVYDCYKTSGETPIYHAHAMKKHGDWVPNAWPHDGIQREKSSNIALKDIYRGHTLNMLKDYAKFPANHHMDPNGNSRDAGLHEMYEYMRVGRFKVFSTLSAWLEEKRLFHRDEKGVVVAEHDDILSATRYAFMMRRYAVIKPTAAPMRPRFQGPIIGRM